MQGGVDTWRFEKGALLAEGVNGMGLSQRDVLPALKLSLAMSRDRCGSIRRNSHAVLSVQVLGGRRPLTNEDLQWKGGSPSGWPGRRIQRRSSVASRTGEEAVACLTISR